MAFKAGSIYGEATLDTKKWDSGLAKITKASKVAALAIGAAFVAGMTVSIKKANEFQKAMTNVATVIDTNQISTKALTRELLLLDPALGNTTDLTQGLYQAFSAGAKSATEAMDITVTAAKFGVAAVTDTNTAVDILTTAMNAYGRESMSAEKAADIFFTTIRQGKVIGEELASSIGMSIPVFAAVGISLEELTAGLAAMTKVGISSHRATTQLNAIVRSFLNPSEDMVTALGNIGYQSGTAFLEVEGLSGALKFMEEATKGDASAILKLVRNSRAMRGVMALTGEAAQTFNDILKEQIDAVGANDEAFAKQEKTFATFRNSLSKLQIVIGNIGKHFVDKIAAGATIANESITSFITSAEGMGIIATMAGYVAGAFSVIKTVFGTLKDAVLPAINMLWETLKDRLSDVFEKTEGSSGAMQILSTVVIGTTVAVTVFSKAVRNSINIFGIWVETLDAVAEAGRATMYALAAMDLPSWEYAAEKSGIAWRTLGKLLGGYVVGAKELFEVALKEMEGFDGNVKDLTTSLNATFKIGFESTKTEVLNIFAELFAGIKAGAEGAGEDLEGLSKKTNVVVQEEFRRARLSETEILLEDLETKRQYYEQAGVDRLELDKWYAREKLKIETGSAKKIADVVMSGVTYMHNAIVNITSQFHTNQRAELELETQAEQAAADATYQAEIDALQVKFDNELISEEAYEEQKAIIEKNAADRNIEIEKEAKDKRNELGKEAFEAEKATKIAGVWVSAASSIMGWWAAAPTLGPIAGPIFAGIMTGFTTIAAIAQTVSINEQQFVPAMQRGGKTGGGATRVNEAGGEIIQLPDQSLVIPYDISQQIAANAGQSTVINVSFAGAQIADNMSLEKVTDHVIRKLGKQMRLAG